MEIQDIKSKLTIGAVLKYYNLAPNKTNHLCCPFHDDKTPSLKVYPETNSYHCFGCGATGDVIQFIQDKEQLTKHEALKKATALTEHLAPAPSTIPRKSSMLITHFGEDLEGALLEMKKYLRRSSVAVAYLQERGLSDLMLDQGYNYKHFRPLRYCITYPLRDKTDKIVSFYGRRIDGKGSHYYLTDRQGLYPNYPAADTEVLILTESIIDAATILKYTNYKVLALYGTNGFTPEHSEALQQWSSSEADNKEIVLFLDGDQEGRKATTRISEQLHELLPKVMISKVNTPDGEDPNSLIQSHEPEILEHFIENRNTLFASNPKEAAVTVETVASKLDVSNPDYISYQSELLIVSVLGGLAIHNLDKLKVTLRIQRRDNNSPLYTLRQSNIDLYNDELVTKLIRKIAERLELGTKEVQHTLYSLIGALEDYRLKQIEVNTPEVVQSRELTPGQKKAALDFLKTPQLLHRTNELIGKTGLIGEESNRLLMYLVFTSRLREQPLHIISLGASGTGKTYLQEKISELIPEDQKLEITALSENALYYFDRTELKNKLVLIEDLDGAQDDKILYAIRELMSKKKISKTIPIKDAKGNLKTVTLKVEGPITLAGTTTKEKIYEDNANRSILIYLDNSPKQKQGIIEYQQKLSAGIIDKAQEKKAVEFLKDIQSMLAPVKVRNPYATELLIPETVFKPLRTNAHYLAFIETITFYCQRQRQQKHDSQTGETYIETTIEDIELANILLKDVLLAKSDELTKGCRDFFERVKAYLSQHDKLSFYSSEIRSSFRMSPNNVKYYLAILSKYHLVKVIGGHPRKQGYEYEVVNAKEYQKLKQSMNALDKVLKTIKEAR